MSTAAWKQPMLWLAFGLPAAVVAAAVATIAVAAGDGSTDTVGDDVRRIAQVQIADVDADVEAARRGVRMQLRREAGGVVVQQVAGDVDAAEPLRLVLRHPARASGDLVAVPVTVALRSRPGPLPQGERADSSTVGAAMAATGDAMTGGRGDGDALRSRPGALLQRERADASTVGAAMAATGDAMTDRRGDGDALRSRPGALLQGERADSSTVGAAMAATGDAAAPPAWRAALSPSSTHAWNVELSGDGWRVVGRWPRDADTVELAPAWPAVANRP